MMTARFSHVSRSSTLLLLLLGVANICQARIGDTLEEAIERYGKPVHKASADEFAMFKEASYYITAHFHDGKTDAITYVKAGSESSTKGAFSDDEIQMLLKINGSGQTWERSKAKAGLQEWKTEDRKFQAVYSESKFLVITTSGKMIPGLVRDFAERPRSKLATARSAAVVSDDEWECYIIFTLWSPLQVIRLLEDSSEQAVLLRQNSPFVSLLPVPVAYRLIE